MYNKHMYPCARHAMPLAWDSMLISWLRTSLYSRKAHIYLKKGTECVLTTLRQTGMLTCVIAAIGPVVHMVYTLGHCMCITQLCTYKELEYLSINSTGSDQPPGLRSVCTYSWCTLCILCVGAWSCRSCSLGELYTVYMQKEVSTKRQLLHSATCIQRFSPLVVSFEAGHQLDISGHHSRINN